MIEPLLTMAVTPGTDVPCRVCGRPLTASAAEGIGPICAEKFHIPRGRRPAAPNQLTFEEPHMPDTTPTRYRKLPIEITAVQLRWTRWNEVCELLGDALLAENPTGATEIPAAEAADTCGEDGPTYLALKVRTVHDELATVRHGDWIIPEAQHGRFYPCKPDVFAKTYEPAADDAEASR